MASSNGTLSFFFGGDSATKRNEKENVPKAIENPLLLQSSTVRVNNNNNNSSAGFQGALTVLASPNNNNNDSADYGGLRQRKKGDSSSYGAPPRASLSTGTGVDLMPSSTATSIKPETVRHRRSFASRDTIVTVHLPILFNIGFLQTSLWNKPVNSSTQLTSRLVPSTTGCWVLIYGYCTAAHYQEILQRFSAHGHVLDRRGMCQPGRSNWVALQYESRLQAEKAQCHQHVALADGIFCGVKRLDDRDPILLQAVVDNSMGLWTTGGSSATYALTVAGDRLTLTQDRLDGNMFGSANGAANSNGAPAQNGGLKEKDILLLPKSKQTGAMSSSGRKPSLCEKILRWILSVDA